MRHFTFLLLLFVAASVKAQFFFDYSPRQRVEQKEDKQKAPSFRGGDEALKKYLKNNFKNPVVPEKVDGRVIIAVIVNVKGNVEETHVVRSLGKGLDDEAIRVCERMKFKPAIRGKQKVRGRVDITIPIRNGRLSFNTLPTTDI